VFSLPQDNIDRRVDYHQFLAHMGWMQLVHEELVSIGSGWALMYIMNKIWHPVLKVRPTHSRRR
jgi:hypothetical protein